MTLLYVNEETIQAQQKLILERKLITRTLAGDNTAFAELMKIYYRVFFALALQYTHDMGKAEDLLQEGWMEIYQSLDSLHDQTKFGSWAYTIVRRKCIKGFKEKITESQVMTQYTREQQLEKTKSKAIERAQYHYEKIINAVSHLPKDYRTIAVLYFFDNMKCEDIAQRLGISVNKVYVYIHRAKKQLKELLKDDL